MQQVDRPATELGRLDPILKIPREAGRSAEPCSQSTGPETERCLCTLVTGRSTGPGVRSAELVPSPLLAH